jgi:hypothetical protein
VHIFAINIVVLEQTQPLTTHDVSRVVIEHGHIALKVVMYMATLN